MLRRSQRLSTGQLASLMNASKTIHSPFFLVRISSLTKDLRIAAIAPKKIAKTAVTRNAIRRRIYEAVAVLLPRISKKAHVAFFAKEAMVQASPTALRDEMRALFVKAGLLE